MVESMRVTFGLSSKTMAEKFEEMSEEPSPASKRLADLFPPHRYFEDVSKRPVDVCYWCGQPRGGRHI